MLADNWVQHADVRERFLAEARLLRRIDSRRVVRVHDVGVAENRPYFVMDDVRGGTLADCVGQLPPDEAVRLGAEAARAVHVLHEAGFAHRDIKPSNLLVDRTCEPARVLVADLGSAKRLADATGFTVTTGTPAYMAPEQAERTGSLDGRADVYSLAVVTWELLTGSRPHPSCGGSRGTGLADASLGPSPLRSRASVHRCWTFSPSPSTRIRIVDRPMPVSSPGRCWRRARAPPPRGGRGGRWPSWPPRH